MNTEFDDFLRMLARAGVSFVIDCCSTAATRVELVGHPRIAFFFKKRGGALIGIGPVDADPRP